MCELAGTFMNSEITLLPNSPSQYFLQTSTLQKNDNKLSYHALNWYLEVSI